VAIGDCTAPAEHVPVSVVVEIAEVRTSLVKTAEISAAGSAVIFCLGVQV
jgi:hypothetical protein